MRISLVTPCYNKGAYLEATLRSVLDQNYADLDYGVVDGGSTDGSRAILDRYADRLSFAISEADNGMYDALAKGFARSNGEIMGYLGADDLHMPWTLAVVADIFRSFPDISWVTSLYPLTADRHGRVVKARSLAPPTRARFFRGAYLPGFSWYSLGWVQQESTFWRRSLWDRVNGLDRSLRLAGDFDLWCRFMTLAEPAGLATPLAAFRRHGDQITGGQARAYRDEALAALIHHGGRPDGKWRSRGREFLRRLGFERTGSVLAFDFDRNAWHRGIP